MKSSIEPIPLSVKAVFILEGGVILLKHPMKSHSTNRGNKREAIKALSRRSLFRLALTAQSTKFLYHSLLTLTYGPNFPRNGKVVKSHLKRMLAWLAVRGMKNYLWFVEFQVRGAPHIHIMTDLVDFQIKIYRADMAKFWSDMIEPATHYYMRVERNFKTGKIKQLNDYVLTTRGAVYNVHRHPKQWAALREKDGAARYVTMYAAKKEQKEVPKEYASMGRFWGVPHNLSLKNLVKTWTYTDDAGIIAMCKLMERDFSKWEFFPKIILGDTSQICSILKASV